jgi:hypothetical protein
MSWFYRKFTKSDDDSTVTLTSTYIQITGSATITGALAQTGNQLVTGNIEATKQVKGAFGVVTNTATVGGLASAGTATVTTLAATTANITGINTLGWATVTNTATMVTERVWTGPIYLGSGTVAIVWGAVTLKPNVDGFAGVGGATGYDKGSLFIGGTAGLYIKTDYASTSWASMDQAD